MWDQRSLNTFLIIERSRVRLTRKFPKQWLQTLGVRLSTRCCARAVDNSDLTVIFSLTRIPRQAKHNGMADIVGDKLRGHLQDMVLAALERGEAHGLEILRRLDAAGDGSLRLKEGSLYPTLYRLEEAGLVKAHWDEET